jgi:hypothetical protein
MFEPRAADLDRADIESALLRGAVGDYADEAAMLLLINFGHWLPQLQSAALITLDPGVEEDAPWAQVAWSDLEDALSDGLIVGGSVELRVLRAAASIAEGQSVDLGDLAGGLDRRGLVLVLAAIAHAAGSHEHREITPGRNGVPDLGDRLPPVVAWPLCD